MLSINHNIEDLHLIFPKDREIDKSIKNLKR